MFVDYPYLIICGYSHLPYLIALIAQPRDELGSTPPLPGLAGKRSCSVRRDAPPQGETLCEVAFEEPVGLLMDADAADEEILGLRVGIIATGVPGINGRLEYDLVSQENAGDELAGGEGLRRWCLWDVGHLGEPFQPAFCIVP